MCIGDHKVRFCQGSFLQTTCPWFFWCVPRLLLLVKLWKRGGGDERQQSSQLGQQQMPLHNDSWAGELHWRIHSGPLFEQYVSVAEQCLSNLVLALVAQLVEFCQCRLRRVCLQLCIWASARNLSKHTLYCTVHTIYIPIMNKCQHVITRTVTLSCIVWKCLKQRSLDWWWEHALGVSMATGLSAMINMFLSWTLIVWCLNVLYLLWLPLDGW